jgi:NAD(P)-dependent dehydrogenase (short-subunit alcohol dehydrogenase family)
MRAYSDSKLANILLTVEPESRLSKADSRVRAVAAHPGIARTNLAKAAGGASARFDRYLGWLLNDVRRGALPIQYAASQDVPGGSYIGPNGLGLLRGYPEIHQPSRAARDPATAHRLWELSTRLTGNGQTARSSRQPTNADHRHIPNGFDAHPNMTRSGLATPNTAAMRLSRVGSTSITSARG